MSNLALSTTAQPSFWMQANAFRNRRSNALIVVGALIGYGLVTWMILAAAGFPDLRLRFDPSELISASLALHLHIGGALTAFGIGTALMLGVKGRSLHKRLGYIWIVAMAVTAVSSFFIVGLNGNNFSLIHGLSAWTVIGLPMGLAAARRRKIKTHAKHMTNMFVGGMLIAGLFSFLPGRVMWSIFFAVG